MYAQDVIPDICWQNSNNSQLHKYLISMHTIVLANANILWKHNIHTKANIYNIGRNARSVTFVETVKNSSDS